MFLRKLPLLDGSLIPQNHHKSFSLVYFGFDLEEKLEKERNIRKTQAN